MCLLGVSLHQGSALYLSNIAILVIMTNTSFSVLPGSPDSSAVLILTSGASIDYGTCTPGTNPGEAGRNVEVGNFTGCPFVCPIGTHGPGGSTDELRSIAELSCEVGCVMCPPGAVCPEEGLGEPRAKVLGTFVRIGTKT